MTKEEEIFFKIANKEMYEFDNNSFRRSYAILFKVILKANKVHAKEKDKEIEELKDCLRKLTKSGLKEKIEARIKAQELLNQTTT